MSCRWYFESGSRVTHDSMGWGKAQLLACSTRGCVHTLANYPETSAGCKNALQCCSPARPRVLACAGVLTLMVPLLGPDRAAGDRTVATVRAAAVDPATRLARVSLSLRGGAAEHAAAARGPVPGGEHGGFQIKSIRRHRRARVGALLAVSIQQCLSAK